VPVLRGGGRHRLLETVRQYARDRLLETGAAEAARARHRDHFLAFAEAAEAKLTGPEQAAWYERLEIEHDNLRAALEWSLADPEGAEAGLRLVGALGRFWEVRGHIAEGWVLATSMLTRPGAERRTPARAKALYTAAALAALQYNFEVVTRHVDESLAIYQEAGDRAGEAALLMASSFRFFHADAATARANLERSLALRREMGDLPGVAECLIHLGDLAWSQGEAAAAQRLMEEALGLNRRLGNSYGVARTLRSLAEWAVDRDNYGEACPLLEAAAAIQKELRDRRKQADYLQLLANLAVAQGDVETARAAYEAGAALFRELDDDKNLAYMAMLPGHILLERGDAAGARARYEEGLALRRKFAPESTGWALLELGHAAWCQGDFAAAQSCAAAAAAEFRERDDQGSLLAVLESLAGVAAAQGRGERAACLWGAAEGLRRSLDIPVTLWWRRSRARILAAAREVFEGDDYVRAQEQGRAMSLEQALGYALERDAAPAVLDVSGAPPAPPAHQTRNKNR
jgi:predicted negative regulator of RcsB-dependent stress response